MKCSSITIIATCLSAVAVNTLLKRDFTLMLLHQVLLNQNTTLRTMSTNALIYVFRRNVPCHRMSPYMHFTLGAKHTGIVRSWNWRDQACTTRCFASRSLKPIGRWVTKAEGLYILRNYCSSPTTSLATDLTRKCRYPRRIQAQVCRIIKQQVRFDSPTCCRA